MMARRNDSDIFLSRELSWLDFNSRVLDEAQTPVNPLLERLRFIAIFANNLDEFFMVRVAGLRQLVALDNGMVDAAGRRPDEQLRLIRTKLDKLLRREHRILYDEILPEMARCDIRVSDWEVLPETARRELGIYFERQVLPVLTPLAVDPSHPFPVLGNGAIEIAVRLERNGAECYAFVEVPEGLDRFIQVADGKPGQCFVALEELIMAHLQGLFLGCRIREFMPFRITRDMDFAIEDTGAEDLMLSIERKLLQRRSREPIRFELPPYRRGKLAGWLENEFQLETQFRYPVRGLLRRRDLFELVGKASRPELLEPPWPPVPVTELPVELPIFDAIRERQPVLCVLPFQEFEPVVRLIEAAAEDPAVLAVKQTLYRVSGNSPVVRALQRAAANGKQVTVIVELKARFDEDNNIAWARKLEESGAHVVYGITGLKIHCKALLIVRREAGLVQRYVHLGTGNYNDKTAKLYTDCGVFSCDPKLCAEVASLFNVMTGYSAPPGDWGEIAAAPFNMRSRFLDMIDREARLSSPADPGRIIAKMNSLSDPEVIRHLHRAAEAGVEVDLIVRGICCLKPGRMAHRIRIVSIVDRFLEHSRIFYFRNGGMPEYYLGSADWMLRNLDRRIELFFAVREPKLRKRLMTLLEYQLEDTEKGRRMRADGTYSRNLVNKHTAKRSQARTYQMFKTEADARPDFGGVLEVHRTGN